MKIQNKEKVVSIILSAELIMYGNLAIRLDKNNDGVLVSWLTVADGGDVVSNEEKSISQREFEKIVESISDLEFIDEEDEDMNICWSLQFGDETDNAIFTISPGCWSRTLFERIVEELEAFLDDEEALYDFNELLSW